MKISLFVTLLALSSSLGCSSHPVMPDQVEVKTSKSNPAVDCQPLGKVTGQTGSVKGTAEQAMSDLKKETVNKGGNFVQVKQFSDTRTTVTGLAFWCP